ncbi:Inositol polyphosphate kinase [Macleaya cordata]|uniref:Inositol polyphosphate multikinase n=1 Tax=Macleaya cordata TaxID=56857 RepID=A0A200R3Q5_MACCD|nr:Inositol polyphosphate kinase [Macleaya cordata]
MLKAPDHQVAGHRADNGKLGPLIDDSGRFYKPLQNDERGTKEVAFYSSFSSNGRIPTHIRRFFPIFHGTQHLEASDGSGLHPHLVLQDLVSNRLNPSVMDIKIGSRTWYPQASEDYIQKCLKKDRESTSLPLGFRISGLRTYESDKSGYWKPDKKNVQGFSLEDVRSALRKFVSSNPSTHTEPDCLFAPIIYGGSDGILAQLLELKAWFEDQTIYQFYSCSILMVYENGVAGEEGRRQTGAEVKLIDFAHVVEGEGVIDHNFLGGLCSLIKFVSEILACPDESTTKGGLQEPEKNQFSVENSSKA